MKEGHIWAIHKRKFWVTTDSEHDLPVAANLLARDFTATKPKWVSDINKGGLVVPGRDNRPVFAQSGRLVDEIGFEDGFAAGGAKLGHTGTKASCRPYSPFGSWRPVCELSVRASTAKGPDTVQYELKRKLLG